MEIKHVLQANNFKFNKKFGQNFISDTNLLNAIVSDAEITKDDVVIEIGPCAGSLTYAIAQQAKKVVAFEIQTHFTCVLMSCCQTYLSLLLEEEPPFLLNQN